MSKTDTGGPAFPPVHDPMKHESGMTLRDWFAGQELVAMGMWIPPGDYVDSEGRPLPQHMPSYQRKLRDARAKWAYAQADAMLAERAKGGDA